VKKTNGQGEFCEEVHCRYRCVCMQNAVRSAVPCFADETTTASGRVRVAQPFEAESVVAPVVLTLRLAACTNNPSVELNFEHWRDFFWYRPADCAQLPSTLRHRGQHFARKELNCIRTMSHWRVAGVRVLHSVRQR
jgi:hypothetical protein